MPPGRLTIGACCVAPPRHPPSCPLLWAVALTVFWFAAFAVFLTWAIRRRYHDDDDRDGSVPA